MSLLNIFTVWHLLDSDLDIIIVMMMVMMFESLFQDQRLNKEHYWYTNEEDCEEYHRQCLLDAREYIVVFGVSFSIFVISKS
jgi:hypothetical protein